jgi:hypothetical protein
MDSVKSPEPTPNLLASDAERADVIEQLSSHCASGRLTLEDFEGRVEMACGARTVAELRSLLLDLPSKPTADTPKPGSPGRPRGGGRPGVRAFTERAKLEAGTDRVHAAVLDSLAPILNSYGYELRQRTRTGLVFERHGRPAWVPVAVVLAFPIGLLALAVRNSQRIVIAFDSREDGGSVMTVYGQAPRAIRNAFAELAGTV